MNKKKLTFWAITFNPLVLIIYGIACYALYSLTQYGGVSRQLPLILISVLLLITWFIWCLFLYFKYKNSTQDSTLFRKFNVTKHTQQISKWWVRIALLILTATTIITGISIYRSATNYGGRLTWVIDDIRNNREVEFVQNNLYEDGIEGLFEDINQEIQLPYELYLSNAFDLTFNSDGEITDLHIFVYGNNEDNEIETFLISYDSSQSSHLTVRLVGHSQADFDEDKRLWPLFEALEKVSIEDLVNEWDEEQYGLYYRGIRNWGYNKEGIVFIDDSDGTVRPLDDVHQEIEEYTVSLYAANNESITPLRIIDYTPESGHSYGEFREEDLFQGFENTTEGSEFFFLTDDIGYELSVMDAATGSFFYVLNKTEDGALNWETINPDPFLGSTGAATGITFIDKQLGFIGLSRGGGAHSTLYRTTDGGLTFERVELPEIEVPLNDTETYNPFDFPEMPYEENDTLYLEVGQGQDGDYNRGSKALLESEDEGATWEFIEEIE